MLLVNLYGSPGAGKSTTRADVFRKLKQLDFNCEEIYEQAKWFTWEKRDMALKVQPYLFGKQLRDTEILKGQVDIAITDSPLLLCEYYGRKYCDYPESFYTAVRDISANFDNLNFFIHRTKKYNPAGRNQTEEESKACAYELLTMLNKLDVPYKGVDGNVNAADTIVKHVLAKLADRGDIDASFALEKLESA